MEEVARCAADDRGWFMEKDLRRKEGRREIMNSPFG
jgi:hypothetical protein